MMLIILYSKNTEEMESVVDRFEVDTTYRVGTPEEMEGSEEPIGDDISDGRKVLLIVPAHAIGLTYSIAEECSKIGVPVWQVKATLKKGAQG